MSGTETNWEDKTMTISAETALVLMKGEQIYRGPDAEAFRSAVEPGEYLIDTTVRIRGKLTVSPDKESAVSTAVPWRDICAVLLGMLNGVSVESVVRQALEGSGKVALLAEQVDERAKKAMEVLVNRSVRTVRGSVKARVEVEELS